MIHLKIDIKIFQSESMTGSKFVFDYVHLLYYECHKIRPKCDGSYIDSPYWINNKKSDKKSNQWKR